MSLPRHLIVALAVTLLGGCATATYEKNASYPRVASTAIQNTDDTYLGRIVTPLAKKHPGESGFYLLTDGIDALAARLLLAERAERSIDVQTHIILEDIVGDLFIGHLLRAADRGVRVRILLDDFVTQGYDKNMAPLESHPNIEIRIFNPFSQRSFRVFDWATEFSRVNHRMHNKSITFDNQMTIVGGRNMGAAYFGASQDYNYVDLDLLGIGPVAPEVSEAFDMYWNSASAVPVFSFVPEPDDPQALEEYRAISAHYVKEAEETPYKAVLDSTILGVIVPELEEMSTGNVTLDDDEAQADTLTWGVPEVVADPPEKGQGNWDKEHPELLVSRLAPVIEAATTEVLVITPYFVPRSEGVEWFGELRERGVRVVLVTNSLASTDQPAVHAAYATYREDLLELGVELWELRADTVPEGRPDEGVRAERSALHAKAFIVDRRHLFVGSFNWDPRSLDINTEMGIVLPSEQLAKWTAEVYFDEGLPEHAYQLRLDDDGDVEWVAMEDGTEVVYDKEPQIGFWGRRSRDLYRVVPKKQL